MNSHDLAMPGSYDYALVALSVLIAVVASWAALDLAGRVTAAKGKSRVLWLSGGAAAMGFGIWSMHYVGMLAFRLPVHVQYDWPTVVGSLLAANLASTVALFVVSRQEMGRWRAIIGSLFMGGGIAAMHYIGMRAMRMPAMCRYSPGIVAISVVLAIVISFLALWLTFYFRDAKKAGGWRKALSAVAMGAAIPVMHYTGMAAVRYSYTASVDGGLAHAVNISTLGETSIIVVTFMVLGLTLLTSLVDRRFAAQALELEFSRRAEVKFKGLLESAPDAMIIVNRHGEIVLVNSQAEKLFGYLRAELLTKSLEMLMPERFRGEHVLQRGEYFGAPRMRPMGTGFEFFALRKDGSEFPAEITLGPLQTPEGILVSSAIRDISERKRFERVLNDAKDAAEAASNAKSSFLTIMSHELRTPLNGIFGMTELVLDSGLSDEQREYLNAVRTSAESLLSMISDILDFTQIEGGKLELEPAPFNLRAELTETVKMLSDRARKKGLELRCEFQPQLPVIVVGDFGRIRQILNILIGNAIKFTEEGRVDVKVDEESREGEIVCLHISVTDTGIGIAKDKLEKIFEPFAQADETMTRKYGGTGMGLTIGLRLAATMGGTIRVQSQPDLGSTFHFRLRLEAQDVPSVHSQMRT